jgi:hypothetical protein
MRRALIGFLAVALVIVATATPAAADPARPTNYESTVTRLDPPTDVVRVDVVGGDSFLHIVVQPGHEVTVLGYDHEPYLRVGTDGTVEQNLRSPAVLLNTDRYASVGSQPADVDSAAEPRWERVGGGGEYVWHDHRSHFMGKALPPQLDGAESGVVYDDWQVPIVVDGTATIVHGRLVRDAPPSPLPWLGVAVAVAVAIALVAQRAGRLVVPATALLVASLVALVVSATGQFGLPVEAGRQTHLVILPVIAGLAAGGAILLRRTPSGVALVAGAALTLPLWVFGMAGVLTNAHGATSAAVGLERFAVTLAIGAVGAATLVAVLHEVRSLRAR